MNTVTSIYGLIDPRTKQIRYIGKANDPAKRYYDHIKQAKDGYKSYKCNWIRNLFKAGRKPVLIILQRYIPLKLWRDAERFWVQYCKDKGYKVTNLYPAGIGADVSEESKKKMSESQKQKWEDFEYKKKHREGMIRTKAQRSKSVKVAMSKPKTTFV